MNSDLLKRLLAKGKGAIDELGNIPGRFRAAKLGGDEAAGKAFRTGREGPWGQTAGGKATNMSANLDDGLNAGTAPSTGPLATDIYAQRPFSQAEMLKRKLAMMSPQQQAALIAAMGGGAGLAAGGLGGYMAGNDE